VKLFLVDFDHVVLAFFTFAHHLFLFALVVIIFITFFDHVAIRVVILILLIVFFFDLLFHALDALILDIDLLAFIFLLNLHLVLVDLVHALLLLLEGLGDSSLLFRVELVEILELLLGKLIVVLFVFLARGLFFTLYLLFVLAIHLVFLIDVLLNQVGSAFHLVDALLDAIHHHV